VHARSGAEHLHRTYAATRPTEEVLLEDRPRAAANVAGRDLLDEGRDVDLGRTRLDARRVGAIEAALGFGARFGFGEERFLVAELGLEAVVLQAHRAVSAKAANDLSRIARPSSISARVALSGGAMRTTLL